MRQEPSLRSFLPIGLALPMRGPWVRALERRQAPSWAAPPRIRTKLLRQRAIVAVAAAMLVAVVATAGVRATHVNKIYPGVIVADVDVGGRSYDAARSVLRRRADAFQQDHLPLTYGDKRWTPTLWDLGVSVDVEGSLRAASDVGRSPMPSARLVELRDLIRHDAVLPFAVRFDKGALDRWFDQVDRDIGQPPLDVTLVVHGTGVDIISDKAGTVVDRAATAGIVRRAAVDLELRPQQLPVMTKPALVRHSDLVPLQQEATRDLTTPVPLSYGGKSWSLAPSDLGQFIILQRTLADGRGARPQLSVNEAALAAWLDQRLAGEIDQAPVDAKLDWRDGLVVVSDSVDGIEVDAPLLARAVGASLLGDHAAVAIPVRPAKPAVDSRNLGALGIRTRLASGSSNYDGSLPDRATNVEVGAKLLNGTLIPPHGEFSFNHAVGVISKDTGFVEAPVIDGERIGRDVGGGICQVSTTVFRAALLAGVPITEWHPHRFRLPFYEQDGWKPGFDASILQPNGDPFSGGDFKFVNPSDQWMLVKAYSDGVNVVVDLYGTDLGYNVRIGEPDISASGLDIVFSRHVLDRTGRDVRTDSWETEFAGWD